MNATRIHTLLTGAALIGAIAACGDAPDEEVVTKFGALTVTGSRLADGTIETLLRDEQNDERLAIAYRGGAAIEVSVLERGDTSEMSIDVQSIGAELAAWNHFTYETWAGMPESGMSTSDDALSRTRNPTLPTRTPPQSVPPVAGICASFQCKGRRGDVQSDADAECQSQPNAGTGGNCHAEVTMVSSGSLAGEEDDVWSFVCVGC